MICCIAGQKFGNDPSPIVPLFDELVAWFSPRISVRKIEHDEPVDISIVYPLGEPVVFVPHSFGFDRAVELAGDLFGHYGPQSGISSEVHIYGADGIKKREWWNPLASAWVLPPNVVKATAFLRTDVAFAPPFHSLLKLERPDYFNIRVKGDHNAMVATAMPDILKLVAESFANPEA